MAKVEQRNIEIFNQVVTFTLLRLYESFPDPIDIDPGKIAGKLEGVTSFEEAFNIAASTAAEAIEFLAEEGYLRYRSDFQTRDRLTFPRARLSLRGLALLGAVPTAVCEEKDRRSFAARLKTAVDKGTSEALASAIGQLLGAALNMGAQTIMR
jgi:hypothetical protein